MRIALCQINPIVGDLEGNASLLLGAADRARAEGAELLISSELLVSGYPPRDLLLREGFVEACEQTIDRLASELPRELGVLVGHPAQPNAEHGTGNRTLNAVTLLHEGRRLGEVYKTLLPTYDVFDEERYFSPGRQVAPLTFQGRKLGVHICEDAWWPLDSLPYQSRNAIHPIAELVRQGAEILINLSASPYEVDKATRREALAADHARTHERPYVLVNQVGGNDDLVFDGQSFAMDERGEVRVRAPAFESKLDCFDWTLDSGVTANSTDSNGDPTRDEQLYQALVVGLRDYAQKSGFSGVVFGLSGGIDSALVASIAADALGAEHVHGLLMPSRYSSDHSVDDARQLADALGLDAITLPIDSIHRSFESLKELGCELEGLTEQNLQSRIRGAMVMARSNHHGWLPIATGNKSELAVGYCTLYGDMVGGYAPLSDVYKTDVYRLARYRNEHAPGDWIPVGTIEKPPSAELAPDQFDQNELPPYDVLDAILYQLIEEERPASRVRGGFSPELVQKVARKLDLNEFKRRQLSPGPKVSARAFGSGRRMPIAARFLFE